MKIGCMTEMTSEHRLVAPLPSHPPPPLSSPGSSGDVGWEIPSLEREPPKGRLNRKAEGDMGATKDEKKTRALGWQRNTTEKRFHVLGEEY